MAQEESFGAALREARGARGLSLAGLSRLVHYSRGYLSKVETGSSKPNAALARRCDEALETGGRLGRMVPPQPPPVPPKGARPPTLRPFDLPPAPARLVGRTGELAVLTDLLLASRPGPGAVRQVVVHGMAGVGKTALTVRAAHEVAGAFPDGCLFLDFHAYGPDGIALSANEALESALRRLGVPGERIPERMTDRSAFYRGTVHGLGLLVVLDNARHAEQVRPLVPGGPGCAVVVTSRHRLAALDDADPIRVGPLGEEAAAALFAGVAGLEPGRIDGTNRQDLAAVIDSCGGLPLALRIVAANHRGSADPYALRELAGRLADRSRLLAELDDGERSARAALAESCADLPPERRDLLALLAAQPGAEIDAAAAAWLAGTDGSLSRRNLYGLVDDNLLVLRDHDRFALHDLIRTYTLETLLPLVPSDVVGAALHRLVTGYLASADAADRLLTRFRFRPELDPYDGLAPTAAFSDAAAANAWFAIEQANLVAAGRLARARGWADVCWQLAYASRGYLFLAKAWDAWIETHAVALDAARAAGADWGEAVTGANLGLALVERGRFQEARGLYERSMAIFRGLGDRIGEATTLGHLAWMDYCVGDVASCLELASAALAIYEAQAVPRHRAITLRTIALAELRLGRPADAARHLGEALALAIQLNLPLDAAMTCSGIGELRLGRGDYLAALRWYRRALELGRACGSDYEQARAYEGLAGVAAGLGRRRAAARLARSALATFDVLDAPDADRLRRSALLAVGPGASEVRDGPDQRTG